MKNPLFNPRVQKAIDIILALFGLFMLYQILRRMFGGSWGIEALIFGLVVLHMGITFGLAVKMTETKTDLRHLRGQFNSLAADFKAHRNEFIDSKSELKNEMTKLTQKVELSLKKRK